jgi:hypothetical protein
VATDLSAFDDGEPDSVRFDFGVKKKMTEHEMPQVSYSIRRDSSWPLPEDIYDISNFEEKSSD